MFVQPTSPPASDPASNVEEVVELSCPECSTGLNLRRKHIGIEGKCVSCHTGIVAIEENGLLRIIRSSEKSSPIPAAGAPPVDTVMPTPSQPAETQIPTPAAVAPSLMAETDEIRSAAPATSSPWGFPEKETDSVGVPGAAGMTAFPTPPSPAPAAEGSFAPPKADPVSSPASAFGMPASGEAPSDSAVSSVSPAASPSVSSKPPAFATPSSPAPEAHAEAPASPSRISEEAVSAFAKEAKPFDNAIPMSSPVKTADDDAAAEPAEAKAAEESMPTETESASVESGWGAKPPTQNHASISPFSTGSAADDPGFAEALFGNDGSEPAPVQPGEAKSPFDQLEQEGAFNANPLFGEEVAAPAAMPSQPAEPEVLDGDGRPMEPMTEEQKEQFAKDMIAFSGRDKKGGFFKKLLRFFLVVVILGGLGYGAYVFMPEEVAEEWKAKVLTWLEPGAVLLDYLPFELTKSEDGNSTFTVPALDGLKEVSTQVDAYQEAALDNLNDTLPEGAEKPIIDKGPVLEIPELPEVKVPFPFPEDNSGPPTESE